MRIHEPCWQTRLRVVLLFVACGLASGFGSNKYLTGHLNSRPIAVWLAYGASFVLAIAFAFSICKTLGWLTLDVSVARCLVAAPLVIGSCPVGFVAGFMSGLLVMMGVGKAFPLHPGDPPSSAGRHILGVFCLTLGIGVGAALVGVCLWAALSIVAPQRGRGAFVPLILSAAVIALVSTAVFLNMDRTFLGNGAFWAAPEILGQTLYAGCAGYWFSMGTIGE